MGYGGGPDLILKYFRECSILKKINLIEIVENDHFKKHVPGKCIIHFMILN